MKTFIIIIEFDKNVNSDNEIDNYIFNLKKKNYNFIYFVIAPQKTNLIYPDRIFINDSKYCFINIIKYINFYFDFIVHLRCLKYINFEKIINYKFSIDKIYVSNDKNNIFCRVVPKQLLKKLDRSYYESKSFEVFNCLYKIVNLKVNYLSNNDNKEIFIQDCNEYDELISVIMTSYNSEKTIEYAIISILNQTYKKIELIIVDDCSTDDTCKIISKYKKLDKRIKLIKLNKNGGCYFAKNIGLKNMNENTKFVAFQDSDDISLISRIYKQYIFMKRSKIYLSTCLYYDDDLLKMPMISKMFSINVFHSLGFFGPKRYGEDEHFYNRFFCLFSKNHKWNNSIIYNSNNIGFFGSYKYYKNLHDILYIVIRNNNSLTKVYKNRKEFAQKMISYYSHLNKQPIDKIKQKCFFSINYVNKNQNENNQIKSYEIIKSKYFYDASIEQAYVSESLNHLKNRFLNKYDLKPFYSYNLPCLFFGIYTEKDIKTFLSIKEKKYVIWAGTDLDFDHKNRYHNFKKINSFGITLSYAISNDLENRMNKYKIKYKRIKFSLLDENSFYPITLRGNNIFIYNGIINGNEEIYGKKIYDQIVNIFPKFNFIFSNNLNISNKEMHQVYKKCFIGLRLTNKDGNANMVEEMLKMNIPVVHNGDYKKAISWKDADSISKVILNKLPKILIIFEKDLNLNDGSLVWLKNFISLIKNFYDDINITVYCNVLDVSLKINNVIFVTKLDDYNFDHIFFRIMENKIKFLRYDNVSLIIHKFTLSHIEYYKKFKFIIAQSLLIKDELKFNNIDNVKILPPLIKKINKNKRKKVISFCYCGTIKKDYQSLELLNLFESLSHDYNFEFNLIYGKLKKTNDNYDNNLLNLISKLKNNKKFNIYFNINKNKIQEILKNSKFGIVIHSKETDFKQQSTKLIEYLSEECIPITYLSYLNSGYINYDLNFRSIKQLKNLLILILKEKIKYNKIEINYKKLKSHLIENNGHIFNQEYITYVTKQKVSKISKIVITNNYENLFLNSKVIYTKDSNILFEIRDVIENSNINYDQKYNITSNFILSDPYNFNINYLNNLFNYKLDKKFLILNNVSFINNIYTFNNNDSYIEFNCFLRKKYSYEISLISEIFSDGILFLLSITNVNNVLKDINRNIHFVKKSNSNLKFIINPVKDDDFIFKFIPSKKNKSSFLMKVIDFVIQKKVILNKICNKIKVINMDCEKAKFSDIYNTFENNGIICERSLGVDGKSEKLIEEYEIYKKNPFNKIEKELGRKLIVSSGALGYLKSMEIIFKEGILKNYEYIMICDDDIRICNNFVNEFDKLYNNIDGKFRLLMLGSSQWDWNDLKYEENYYIPNEYSNGSFANIYHRSTFEIIYNHLINFSHPFDDLPMKSNFKNNFCYVSYPNLIIAQLEKSSIRQVKNNRSYEKFKWIKDDYTYLPLKEKSIILKQIIKEKKLKIHFVIGIITFNRCEYLKKCIKSLIKTFDKTVNYTIIIADGNSKDETIDFINNLSFDDNISLIIINNQKHFIYRQSNSILKFCSELKFDFGFLINDDIIFKKIGWDISYYNAYLKTNYDHLVYFDKKFKKQDHQINDKYLQSYCKAENCQGAFFTFTKKVVNDVGYFDEENFKIRGHSHIDFTLRCCRLNFNDIVNLYDLRNSENYLELNNNDYESSFIKLPFELRELYKVNVYELDKRNKILMNNSRILINSEIELEKDN